MRWSMARLGVCWARVGKYRYQHKVGAAKMASVEIDLRSDTLTKPSADMYQAMVTAPVGDDVMNEDPTINELQVRCAKMFNKEAALFVPSGAMGNLLCVMTHCTERGAEAIMGKSSHIFLYECGGLAQLAGVHTNAIVNSTEDGTLNLEEIKVNIRDPSNVHYPKTKVICLENTQNRCGGLVLPVSYFQQVRKLATENGIAVHLDGARLMNACVATGVEPTAYTDLVDSVSLCFSKGLGAPFGAIIAGSAEFCLKARHSRKALGGGMRQGGVLAGAALYALDNNVLRLKDDHDNAARLAKVVVEHGGNAANVDMKKVHTNIVFITLTTMHATTFSQRMAQVTKDERAALGSSVIMKMDAYSDVQVRYVCHLNISKEDIELAAIKMKYVLNEINQLAV